MANQFFEYEGGTIDLAKVTTWFRVTPGLVGPIRVDFSMSTDGNRVILTGRDSEKFLAWIQDYRESLKPKYEDGWYWLGIYGVKPDLNYVKNGKAYYPDGVCRTGDLSKLDIVRLFSIEDVPSGI